MIKTKKELRNYIKADFIMNHGDFSFKKRLRCFLLNDLIIKYLKQLRKTEYSMNKKSIFRFAMYKKLCALGYRTGFSFELNVLGYGVTIPHHGTIVIGGGNHIGNFCVLHTSTCITAGNKNIGDGLYLSCGSIITKDVVIADNVSIGANSLVNKSIETPNCLFAGSPASFVKNADPWYIRDGNEYEKRVEKVKQIFLQK